jgi:hypothetical protein
MQGAPQAGRTGGADDEGAGPVETTTFLKPKFAISTLPGTGELQVQVKANAEKPVRALTLPASVIPTTH